MHLHSKRGESFNALSKSASVNEGETLGLSVMDISGNERKKVTPVFLDWDDVRLKLVVRNTTLTKLGSRVAASHLDIPWRPD